MIEVHGKNDDLAMLISGKEVEPLAADDDQISAECNLPDLAALQSLDRSKLLQYAAQFPLPVKQQIVEAVANFNGAP